MALPSLRRRSRLPRTRTAVGWAIAVPGTILFTVVLARLRSEFDLPATLLSYLLVVVFAAAVGGVWPGLAASIGASLAANWYFTPPFHTLLIGDENHLVAFVVFTVVGLTVGGLVGTTARRTNEAQRASAESEMLARIATTLVGRDDAVGELMQQLRSTFSLEAAALLRLGASGWRVEAHAGTPCPTSPEHGDESINLNPSTVLSIVGRKLEATDRRVLHAFTAQLLAALESRRLQMEAADAQRLQAVNELRTAILVAVSHDLRTPLASIKASVTSLLQDDVEWDDAAVLEFLSTIDTQTDRLNKLVGNLLDMSRLQTGRVDLVMREVGLVETVSGAVATLRQTGQRVSFEVPESLLVWADAALLERAIANLIDNALLYAPAESIVRVSAVGDADRVLVFVIDHGKGIPIEDREQAFVPFQRLGDRSNRNGVGLGLAVARGFVEAMGGTLKLLDTSGGGLTVEIEMKAAT